MNEFGKKLKELRGNQSIREASRNIGISHTYLDSLEKGVDPRTGKERKPTIEVVQKLSQYYNIDFFDLSRLSGVFVSLKDTPETIKQEEMKKMKEKFRKYFNDKEIKVRNAYIDIMTDELSTRDVIFWQNIHDFYIKEKDSDELQIEGEEDTNIIIFISSLFKLLNECKNSGNEELYKELVQDIDKFLKSYINIK